MKPRILFVCLGNSCRSIMAEALARHFHGDRVAAASAGINPLGFVVPETISVLLELGVMTLGLTSKGLDTVDLPGFALIVNLTHHDLQRSLPPPLHRRVLPRPVLDPYGGGLETYRKVRNDIHRLLDRELAGWVKQAGM